MKPEQNQKLVNEADAVEAVHDVEPPNRGLRFWLCIVSLMVSSFLMVFELVSDLARVVPGV